MSLRYLIGFDLRKIRIHRRADMLIVGGGVAGLTAAVTAAKGLRVHILMKSTLRQSNTWLAQGGIAAALAPGDSPDLHYRDTLSAGAGACDSQAVRVLVDGAAEAISTLRELGVDFDSDRGQLKLGLEGGHSLPRVVHAGDSTGSAIVNGLTAAARRDQNISLTDKVFVIDLLVADGRCVGVLIFDQRQGAVEAHLAPAVVIAAGGVGQLYSVTTNPSAATGDGQAMAARKGVGLADLEFIQFHPTALAVEGNPRFLISEALRGEGAFLVDENQARFMVDRHPLAELAPRDIVCQAMASLMRDRKTDHVFLDARHLPSALLAERFPGISSRLREYGLDLTADLIPVAPAAHYLIGGIKTDIDGRTSLPGLYAAGEAACTGVHGANRLASNSLLEGVVFSRRAGQNILENFKPSSLSPDILINAPPRPTGENLAGIRPELQSLMTESVGLARSFSALSRARERLRSWLALLERQYDNPHDWETANMILLAERIVAAAQARHESIGVHQIVD